MVRNVRLMDSIFCAAAVVIVVLPFRRCLSDKKYITIGNGRSQYHW